MWLFALALACTGDPGLDDTGEAPAPTEGQLALRFRIDTDYQAAMNEPAIGPFRGSFWRADEVTGLGPNEGAEPLGDIDVPAVDLVAANPTEVLFTSGPLPAISVIALGFLDSDGNADPEDAGPDSKDPVTLPNQNLFVVVAGETAEVTVVFGFLNP